MAHYLVSATPRTERLEDLQARLAADEFIGLQPFGSALLDALRNARRRADGVAVWKEEDDPQAQGRRAAARHPDDRFILPLRQ